MPHFPRKFVSCLMIMAIVAMSISACFGSACAGGLSAAAKQHDAAGKATHLEKDSSSCPCDDNDSSTGHCDSSCSCPCHASLPAQLVRFSVTRIIIPLEFHESFQAIPEVYLPKFVPPHICA